MTHDIDKALKMIDDMEECLSYETLDVSAEGLLISRMTHGKRMGASFSWAYLRTNPEAWDYINEILDARPAEVDELGMLKTMLHLSRGVRLPMRDIVQNTHTYQIR